MEKQGVIKEGLTPPEHEPKINPPSAEKRAQPAHTVNELDDDFRKRAAEVARTNTK